MKVLLKLPIVAVRMLSSVWRSQTVGNMFRCLRFYLGLPDWGLCSPRCLDHS